MSCVVICDIYLMNEGVLMLVYVIMGMLIILMIGFMIGGVFEEMFLWYVSFVFLMFVGLLVLWMFYKDMGEIVVGGGILMCE